MGIIMQRWIRESSHANKQGFLNLTVYATCKSPCKSFHNEFCRQIWWWHQQKCNPLEYTLWVNHWTDFCEWHTKLTTIDIPTQKYYFRMRNHFTQEKWFNIFPFVAYTVYILLLNPLLLSPLSTLPSSATTKSARDGTSLTTIHKYIKSL